jgi:isocitrate/isopropylmalate dehydrogenase
MLRHLGLERQSDRLESAVGTVLAEGKVRPPDLKPLGRAAKTDEVAEAICAAVTAGP